MNTFGERLRTARKAKGLTQRDLSELVHTNQNTISEYETGAHGVFRPDVRLLFRIAKELDVSVEWLLYGNS